MTGRIQLNKERFRKHDSPNINWEDRKETAYGAKLYRQSCLRCGADRGYKPSCDWNRKCQACKFADKKMSKAHRRLRASMKASVGGRLRQRKASKGGNPVFPMVGYSLDDLVRHLESKFQPGMSWDNYGQGWHVDHIRPDSSFNYDSYEHSEFKECWALENLQPMWAQENWSKSAKWER